MFQVSNLKGWLVNRIPKMKIKAGKKKKNQLYPYVIE